MTKFIVKYEEFGKEKEFVADNMLSAVLVLKNATSFEVWKEDNGNRKIVSASTDRIKFNHLI